jgi:RNA polymerase-interacting CarD/CdnL/TRCF family regulator
MGIMLLNSKNMTNIKKHFTTKENECSTIQQEKTKAFQTPKVILYAFIVLLLYGNKTIKHLPSNILQVFKWVVDRSKKKLFILKHITAEQLCKKSSIAFWLIFERTMNLQNIVY